MGVGIASIRTLWSLDGLAIGGLAIGAHGFARTKAASHGRKFQNERNAINAKAEQTNRVRHVILMTTGMSHAHVAPATLIAPAVAAPAFQRVLTGQFAVR